MRLLDAGVDFIDEFEHNIDVEFGGVGEVLLSVLVLFFELVRRGNLEVALVEAFNCAPGDL